MIELMDGLPEGVAGVRFSGRVTAEEYRDALLPRLTELAEGEDRIRLLVLLDAGFERFEPGALWEDTKFGVHDGLRHASKFLRTALVSDADWAHHVIGLFGWMVPGDIKAFDLADLDAATAWVAGG